MVGRTILGRRHNVSNSTKATNPMSDEDTNIAIAELVNGDNEGPFPNYCNDLNAIREAVMTLPENKQVLYGGHLAWACGHTDKGSVGLWKISTATARQRAEAFLRTLGKWESH